MIKSENRLRGEASVKRTLNKGRNINCQFFRVRVLEKRDKTSPSQATIVISKKIASLATDRNLYRRRLKAALGAWLSEITGYDMVFFPNGSIKNAAFEKIKEDVNQCFEKLR